MLGKRETQILQLLVEQQPTYLTSQEIARVLAVSNRTARKYLHLLQDELQQTQLAQIVAKPGYGYQLVIQAPKEFDAFYFESVKETPVSTDIRRIQEAKDRHYYLLNQLFFEQKEVYVEQLAEELFVSRSTISNDLVEIKRLLQPYQLTIQSRSNKGIYVVGKEQNIRHFMMNYFFMERLHDNLFAFSMYTNLLTGISMEEIVIIILDECREAQLKLSDFIVYNLVLHIGLAIKRMNQNYPMETEVPLVVDQQSLEYQTALRILTRVERELAFKFPACEADFITMHLSSKVAAQTVFQKNTFSEAEIKAQLLEVLEAMDQETGFSFAQDKILIDGLMMHFTPLFLRLQSQTRIENPLLAEIQTQYPELFALTVTHFAEMPAFAAYHMTESEWAYLAIHITAAVERFYNEQKAQVLVICATGLGSSQMIKNRLEREFGSKIYIKKVISYYELGDQDLSQIDLIISAINLQNVVLHVPIVRVSVFLSATDIQKINHEISRFKGQRHVVPFEDKQQENIHKKIQLVKQHFHPELFFHFDQQVTKDHVLTQLLTKVEELEQQPLMAAFMKQLKLRESYSSVVFAEYLAVPHPIEAVTKAGYVGVAVAPAGVQWEAEYQHVQLVFLLSPDQFGQFELEKVSQMLGAIMDDDVFRQALVNSTSYEAFMAVFIAQIEKNGC